MNEPVIITYRFELPDGQLAEFTVNPGRRIHYQTLDEARPRWTRIEQRRCPVCPLEAAAHCPAALDIVDIVNGFAAVSSFEMVGVHVLTPERDYFKRCDARTALRSLMGLILATGECPVLSGFRGLARFHLPFANRQEAIFRSVSACLLKNYFALGPTASTAAVCDLGPLIELYQRMQTVNQSLCERLRLACEAESSVSALVQFFSHSVLFTEAAPKYLEELRDLFE